jgi:hypothetical protein
MALALTNFALTRLALTNFAVTLLAVIRLADTILSLETGLLDAGALVLADFGAELLLIKDFLVIAIDCLP